jgi:hypothetical protein
VSAVTRRYYIAAAHHDGGGACSLFYLLLRESVVENYGKPPGPPSLRGKTCAVVMTKFFKQHHRHLSAEAASLRVTGLRVRRNRGTALLRLGKGPVRYILVARERGAWKVNSLLDIGMP